MRALMIPIAVGYGTTARNLAVARELTKRGHEAFFAAGADLEPIIQRYGFETRVITDVKIDPRSRYSIQEQAFGQQVAGRFLENLLADILTAVRDFAVDVIVFSNNNMASLAAAKMNIPSVSIFHPAILEIKTVTMFRFAYHKWRKWGDLAKRENPARTVVSGLFGDLNFIPSLPQFIKWPLLLSPEIYAAKGTARPTGALTVRPVDELPGRDELRREFGVGEEPFIYATIGGAVFNPEFLEKLAGAFDRTDYRVIITAGAQTSKEVAERLSRKNITVGQYVPEALRIIKACDVLIWHGGHETMMEAVATGRPGVVVPQQLDQKTNAVRFSRTGAGIMIPKRRLTPQRLFEAVNTVLRSPSYYAEAERLRRQNEALGGVRRIVDEIERLR
ncbi:MAG: hypothetical protein M1358_25640, partial [Chloroflexi bacterium]|nr:hypothetical protein [Chloroflexota bacterium]